MQKITQQHVLQNGQSIKAQQAQQLEQYNQDQIVEPTQQYLNETIAQHLQGLTPNFTEVQYNLQAWMPVRSPVYCTKIACILTDFAHQAGSHKVVWCAAVGYLERHAKRRSCS